MSIILTGGSQIVHAAPTFDDPVLKNRLCERWLMISAFENIELPVLTKGSLVPDGRLKSIPLHFQSGGYMGYEFLRYNPPRAYFNDSEGLRHYLINPPYHLEKGLQEGPERGQLSVFIKNKDKQPSENEVREAVKRALPSRFFDSEWAYIRTVYEDAVHRGHNFNTINIEFRTEGPAFEGGHNHQHFGDLTYSRAKIGRNTEVDSLNRYDPSPHEIQEHHYIKIEDENEVAVFGDVWHRTPPPVNNQFRPRQITIISFSTTKNF